MVSAWSIPRPAYNAAHRPAGPAPTMMTSYSRFPFSGIRSKFQSRGIALSRQGPRQLRAELNGFELYLGPLRPGQPLQRRRTHDDRAVPVAAGAVQQRRRGLDQPLKDPGFVLLNNRTPHGFQRLMRQPEFPGVKEIAGVLKVAAAGLGLHVRGARGAVRGQAGFPAYRVPLTAHPVSAGSPLRGRS